MRESFVYAALLLMICGGIYLVTQGIPSEHMVARGFGVANSAAGSVSRIYKQKSGVELIPLKNEPVTTNLAYSFLDPSSLN